MPVPVGSVESAVQEHFYLGHAAPGAGRARRAAPSRDAGCSQEAVPPTGLKAPAVDGFRMSYHRKHLVTRFERLARYFITWGDITARTINRSVRPIREPP